MSTAAAQFKQDARRLTADLRHRQTIQTAMGKYEVVRDKRKAAFQDSAHTEVSPVLSVPMRVMNRCISWSICASSRSYLMRGNATSTVKIKIGIA